MGIEHECQVPLPLIYKGTKLDCGYRMDLVVAGWLLLELKAVDKLDPLQEAAKAPTFNISTAPIAERILRE